MSINKVMLTGNLTRDPELKSTSTGTALLRIGIAVNDRRYNAKEDKFEDLPNFIECVMFGKRGESLEKYLKKGAKVAIEGKLRWSSWTANDGTKRSKLEVIIEDLEFLTARPLGQGQPSQAVASQPSGSVPASSQDVLQTQPVTAVPVETPVAATPSPVSPMPAASAQQVSPTPSVSTPVNPSVPVEAPVSEGIEVETYSDSEISSGSEDQGDISADAYGADIPF